MELPYDYRCTFSKEGRNPRQQPCWYELYYSSSYAKDDVIHIANFKKGVTEKYIELVVGLINQIQPCQLVTADEKTYIAYTLIGNYNHDLILLNFIRNLWHQPAPGYSAAFFEKLDEIKDSKKLTPMEKLTTANLHACVSVNYTLDGGHSNCAMASRLKVRDIPETFYTWDSPGTRAFLYGTL